MTPPAASSRTIALDPNEIVERIRSVLPHSDGQVALHEPRFNGNEKRYVVDCIDTGWVSYSGAYVERFESALAEACGTAHAVAVVNGTVAIQVALHAAGVLPGDEVLIPAFTFVATANAVVHAGAIPHFVDIDDTTLGISPHALEAHLERMGRWHDGALFNRHTQRRIAAMVPVHVFGHPVDFDQLAAVAARYGLTVVEDAAESLGSLYKGRPCGSLATLATLSFNGNKIVTTGGGGAILTNDEVIAMRLRHLTTTAKQPHPWAFFHDEVAWNFRLPNLNAALGLAQIESLSQAVAQKRKLRQLYAEAFENLPGLRVLGEAAFAKSNYWLISLLLEPDEDNQIEPILAATNGAGLATRRAWTPLHRLPMYAMNPRAPLPVTESISERLINVPSSPFLCPA